MSNIKYKGLILDSFGMDTGSTSTVTEKEFTEDMLGLVQSAWTYICPECGKKMGLNITDGSLIDGIVCCVKGCCNKATDLELNVSCIEL